MAAFTGALNGYVTNSDKEEHDYSDYDAERYGIHFCWFYFIFLFSFLGIINIKEPENPHNKCKLQLYNSNSD